MTKRPGDWLFILFLLALMAYTVGSEALRLRALWSLGSVPLPAQEAR